MQNFRKLLIIFQMENKHLIYVFYFLIVAVLISVLLRLNMINHENLNEYNKIIEVIEVTTEVDTNMTETELQSDTILRK